MELETATTMDIANELANRGVQFVIAIEVVDNNKEFGIHLCVDGKKNQSKIANIIAPLFNRS